MRKRHLGRLLSAALSATLAFTSVIPSYAMEGMGADEISEAQEESELEEEPAGITAEETEEPEEDLAAASAGSEEEEEVLIEEDENEELAGGFERVDIYITFTDVANSYSTNNYDQTVWNVEDTATFELKHPEKEGHTFDVWDKGDQENVTVGTKGEENTPITVSGINSGEVNIRLTAKWNVNKYKVVYDANGGSGDAMAPDEDVAYDTTEVKIKDNALKAPKGMQFVKWNTAPDGKGVDKAPGDSAGGFDVENGATVTLYAQWEYITYSIEYNPGRGAGSVVTDSNVAYNTTSKLRAADTFTAPNGEYFVEWNTAADGTGTGYAAEADAKELTTTDGATVKLYAQWKAIPTSVKIKVMKVVDGGEPEAFGEDVDVAIGSYIAAALEAAGKNAIEGKTFGGFFRNAACTTALDEDLSAGSSTTIYAKFTTETTPAEDCEVTFWDGDKELTSLKQTVKSGEKATRPAKDPTKTNYEFKGWFTTDELSEEFDFDTPITKATKIYAKFVGKPIKITLDKNCKEDVVGLPAAGEGGFVGITVNIGGKYTGLKGLTREGYEFVGWFTAKEHGSKITADSDVKFTKDATLYARWIAKECGAYFEENDDEAELSYYGKWVKFGTKVLSIVPTVKKAPEGYKLEGWYAAKDKETGALSNKVDEKTVIVDDTNYYAKWVPITYKVKFDLNGGKGTVPAVQSRTFGDGTALPATTGITKDHCTFAGWNTVKTPTDKNTGLSLDDESTANVTTVDGATVTLYAQWKVYTYELTYDYGYSVEDKPIKSIETLTYGKVYPAPDANKLAGRPGYYLKGWKNGDTDVDITKPFKGEGDVTLTADWGEVTYKATFNSNNSKKQKKTITLNAEHTDAISFVREDLFKEADAAGLTFEGWATADTFYAVGDNDLTEKDLIAVLKGDKTSATKEVTTVVYAQWAAAGKYKIKLKANLPTSAKPEDLRVGLDGRVETVNFAEPFFLTGSEFRLDGYALVGWTYKNAKGKTVTVKPAAKLVSLTTEKDKTVEVSAKWKATSYTLKYNLNGGTAKKGTKTTVKYKLDANTRKGVALLNYKEADGRYGIDETNPAVTRRGYKFSGWENANGYYGKDLFQNLTVVAKWAPISYTLHLDAGDGIFGDYKNTRDVSVNFDSPCNLFNHLTYKDGHTFTGWIGKGVNGKAVKIAPDGYADLKLLAFDEDGTTITLKATFKAKTGKITYNANGGTIDKNAPKSYTTDSAKNKAIPDPVKVGYKFAGWTLYTVNDDDVTDEAFDATTKMIKNGVSGDLRFWANWDKASYDVVFKSSDGKTTYNVGYIGIGYSTLVDFTRAALAIEKTPGFSGSVKGFATAPNAKKVTYALNRDYSKIAAKSKDETITLYVVGQDKINRISYDLDFGTIKDPLYEYKTPTKADLKLKTTAVKNGYTFKGFTCRKEDEDYVVLNDKGFVTAIKKDAAKDLEFKAVYGDEISYSIVVMPNASNVFDDYGKVNAKKGVQFEMDGDKLFPVGNEIQAESLWDYLNWSRPGYRLMGFATTKSGKPVNELGGLPFNKKKVATLYAIWKVNQNTIHYSGEAQIIRGGVDHTVIREDLFGIRLSGYATHTYGKALAPKKLKNVKGYTFKGWRIDKGYSYYESGVTYTDKTKRYVKSIAKNNIGDIHLIPVFEENYYNVYINPNGGTYKGSKKKQFVGRAFYSDTIVSYMITRDLVKSGSTLSGVSTTKNAKGLFMVTGGLSAKNKASVTINAIWNKATVTKPSVSAAIDGTSMEVNFGYSEKASTSVYYEIQYSPSSSFSYNTKTITLKTADWTEDTLREITEPVVAGNDYYLRARMFRMDSTGKYICSGWSATARASRTE